MRPDTLRITAALHMHDYWPLLDMSLTIMRNYVCQDWALSWRGWISFGHSLFWHMRHPGTNLGDLFFAAIHSRVLLFMRAGFKTSVPCTVREKIRINYTDIKECNSFFHYTVPGVKTNVKSYQIINAKYAQECIHVISVFLCLKWYG